MDYSFPDRLFPAFFSSGPPNCGSKHTAGGWGEYKGILNTPVQGGSNETHDRFIPRRRTHGEPWSPSEPVVLPLLPPKPTQPWLLDSSDMADHEQHMQNFYLNHYDDAFGSVGGLLHEHFNFHKARRRKRWQTHEVSLGWTTEFLSKLKHRKCEYSYLNRHVAAYDDLLRDVLHDIPPALLGGLLREELQQTGQQLQFSEAATGGALAHTALPRDTCLLYSAGPAFSRLTFQQVSLRCEEGGAPWLEPSGTPSSMEVKGPVRQISCSTLLSDCCVAVRSDYMCGVWRCNGVDKPKVLQVIKTTQPATCITASPHVLGEVLVADESGSAHLWTVGKGMLKVRSEDSNLYFNASSPWRWCEFSAHPRVMLYTDRTGAELTDLRAANAPSYTLFRISRSAQCRSGERVVLGRYLVDAHPFHHLVTTQYSAYIMDERFPILPMLKWDHMMQAPPIFAQVLPGHASSSSAAGGSRSTKVVIGSQSSQEIVMLQYSGGSAEACVSLGPPQELLRPRDSLDHLPVQLPHRTQDHRRRLALPAAGLACFPGRRGDGGAEDSSVCVVQLTEAGDLFYQVLRPAHPEPGPETDPEPGPGPVQGEEADGAVGSQPQRSAGEPRPDLVAEDTGSEDEMIGPTQIATGPPAVPETPERERESSSEEEEEEEEEGGHRGGKRRRQYWGLEVVVNEESGGIGVVQPEAAATTAAAESSALAVEKETGPSVSERTDHVAPPSERAAQAWRGWLQRLLRCRAAARAEPEALPYPRATVRGFKLTADRQPIMEDRLRSLGRDLRESMASGSLLLHGATFLPRVAPPALPDTVRSGAWLDLLSERLTISWRGEEQWRSWWMEKLGLNRKEAAEALRAKRRREKARKRRGSQRSLDGSGWSSSGLSLRGWSDTDDGLSQSQSARWSEPGSPRSGVSQSGHWSEPGSPRSGVSRASQQQHVSPGFSFIHRGAVPSESVAGSLPDPKEGTPRHVPLLDANADDLEPLFSWGRRPAGGSVRTQGSATTPGPSTPGRSTAGHSTSRLSQASLGRPGTQSSQVKRKRSQMGF